MARTNLASGFAGFLIGVVTGCAICAAAAVFITNSPIPFVEKVQKVTADVDPAQKLAGGIDPNRALNEPQEKSAEQDDSSGVKTVTVAPPVQSQPQSQTPAAGAGGSYWLQAGAFKEEKSAHDLTGSLALTAGISNVQVVKAGSVWRVRIGPFDNKLEASEVQSQLDNQGIQTTVVR